MRQVGACWVDWRVGTRVYLAVDHRHTGEVAQVDGAIVTVRWENGWLSEHRFTALRDEKSFSWHR